MRSFGATIKTTNTYFDSDIALTWTKKLFWAIYFVFGVFIAAVIGVLVPIFTQKKNPDAIPS